VAGHRKQAAAKNGHHAPGGLRYLIFPHTYDRNLPRPSLSSECLILL